MLRVDERRVGNAGQLPGEIGRRLLGPQRSPQAGMHARYKREHGSDGAHRNSTKRGEDTTAEPVPKVRQWVWNKATCERHNQQVAPQWWQIQDNATLFREIFCVAAERGSAAVELFGWRVRPRSRRPRPAAGGGSRRCAGLIQQAWTRPLRLSAPSDRCCCRAGSGSGTTPGCGRPGSRSGRRGRDGGRRYRGRRARQADHAAAEPDAFGIAGRPVDRLLRLGEFVDLLRLPWPAPGAAAGRLVRRLGVAALGKGGRRKAENAAEASKSAAHNRGQR